MILFFTDDAIRFMLREVEAVERGGLMVFAVLGFRVYDNIWQFSVFDNGKNCTTYMEVVLCLMLVVNWDTVNTSSSKQECIGENAFECEVEGDELKELKRTTWVIIETVWSFLKQSSSEPESGKENSYTLSFNKTKFK